MVASRQTLEQRAREPALPLGHRRKPGRRRSRQRPHQHGLGLIVGGVTERDHRRADPGCLGAKRRMASRARPVLQRAAGLDLDGERAERETSGGRERAHQGGLTRGALPEPVIHVRHRETPAAWRGEPRHRVEERRRVRAAAAGDQDRLTGEQHTPPVGGGGDRAADPRHRGTALGRLEGPASSGCGGSWTRTRDIPGMNRLLYHLS